MHLIGKFKLANTFSLINSCFDGNRLLVCETSYLYTNKNVYLSEYSVDNKKTYWIRLDRFSTFVTPFLCGDKRAVYDGKKHRLVIFDKDVVHKLKSAHLPYASERGYVIINSSSRISIYDCDLKLVRSVELPWKDKWWCKAALLPNGRVCVIGQSPLKDVYVLAIICYAESGKILYIDRITDKQAAREIIDVVALDNTIIVDQFHSSRIYMLDDRGNVVGKRVVVGSAFAVIDGVVIGVHNSRDMISILTAERGIPFMSCAGPVTNIEVAGGRMAVSFYCSVLIYEIEESDLDYMHRDEIKSAVDSF